MAIHSTARGRAAARQAASDLARALPRVLWSYPRRNPVTFTYLVLVCAGLLVLGRLLPGPTADQIKIAISTNPHNMAHRPLTVLATSPLFAATDSGLLSHVVVIGGGVGICMASLERRIGAVPIGFDRAQRRAGDFGIAVQHGDEVALLDDGNAAHRFRFRRID